MLNNWTVFVITDGFLQCAFVLVNTNVPFFRSTGSTAIQNSVKPQVVMPASVTKGKIEVRRDVRNSKGP